MNRTEIEITPGAFVTAAACVLLLPLKWIISVLIAAAVHEMGHLAALKYCGIPVCGIRIGSCGVKILTVFMLPKQEILCSAAGPLCSLSLLLLWGEYPLLSFIGLVQGVFNLLPFYPMDGGRIVKAIVRMIREMAVPKKNSLQRRVSASTIELIKSKEDIL